MKYYKLIIFTVIVILLSCHSKNDNKRIDIKYSNYTLETIAAPKWEEVIKGEHPAFLVRSSINNVVVYFSILYLVNSLKPMNKEIIPPESYPYMQCIIHYPDGHTSTLVLGSWYSTLDSIAIIEDTLLVKMLRKYSGFNHPPLEDMR